MSVGSFLELFEQEKISLNKEKLKTHTQLLVDYTEDIRCDLENLLNTPHLPISFSPGLFELIPSLVDYGTPSYLNYALATMNGQEIFCKKLEKIILFYETRLQNTKVTIQKKEGGDENKGILSFLIQGEINFLKRFEPISYDLLLSIDSCTFIIDLKRN